MAAASSGRRALVRAWHLPVRWPLPDGCCAPSTLTRRGSHPRVATHRRGRAVPRYAVAGPASGSVTWRPVRAD
jgi:hypothetical protein